MMRSLKCNKIQIESTNICNLNCKICPRKKLGVPLKHMKMQTYAQIMQNIKYVRQVDLTGWGEPLCNPMIFEMIQLAAENDKYVSLTTNATLLNKTTIDKLIRSGLNGLAISLDSIDTENTNLLGHSCEDININLGILSKSDHSFRLRVQTIYTGQPIEELMRIADKAVETGAFEMRLIRCDQRLLASKIDISGEKTIFYLLKNLYLNKIHITMAQYSPYADWRDWSYRIYQTLSRNQCPKTFSSAYVNVHGQLTPCCNLPKYCMGDLASNNINNLWNSEKFNYFRQHQKKVCQNCQVLTL